MNKYEDNPPLNIQQNFTTTASPGALCESRVLGPREASLRGEHHGLSCGGETRAGRARWRWLEENDQAGVESDMDTFMSIYVYICNR